MFNYLMRIILVLFFVSSNLLLAQSLPMGPSSYVRTKFFFDQELKKYPIELKWDAVPGATLYEIEWVQRLSGKKNIFFSRRPLFHIEVLRNRYFSWRVRAMNGETAITDFSPSNKIIAIQSSRNYEQASEVDAGESEDLASESDDGPLTEVSDLSDADSLTSTEDLEPVISEPYDESYGSSNYTIDLWDKAWLRAGLGIRFTDYKQSLAGNNSATSDESEVFHSTNGKPSLTLNGGIHFTDKISTELNLNLSKGSYSEDANLENDDYVWYETSLEGIYLLDDSGYKTKDSHWHARLGLAYQTISLVASFPAPANNYELVDNSLLFISAGGGFSRLFESKFRTHLHLNLLYNVMASTSDFDYTSELGFGVNSVVRAEYKLYENFNVSAHWQFQYLNIGYELTSNDNSIEGKQRFTQNHLGLSLTYEFN